MTDTKEFPIADVLMTVSGICLQERGIDGVYRVLNWMTGESVYTHQIPRIGREAEQVILAAHPELAVACQEARENINPGTLHHWLEVWTDRYGPMISVPRMIADQHERIDPLSELVEAVHPDKIVAVRL